MKSLYQNWTIGGSGYAVLQDKLIVHNRMFNNDSVIEDSKNYMYVEALEDGLSVQFNQVSNASANSLEYSTDQKVWKTTSNGVPTDTINVGEKLYFRGDVTNMDTTFVFDDSSYSMIAGIGTFVFDKKCNVGGNIMSLLFNDNFEDKYDLSEYDGIFYALFGNVNQTGMLIHADKLILPAKILSTYCYNMMFIQCTSLITAPELPAITLTELCYGSMFCNCTSLVIAPELPATTLAKNCYASMFAGCTSLTTTPELPATTLALSCYQNMFEDCTSLITAPKLPATTITKQCYDSMFSGCTSLVIAPELSANILEQWCYMMMFDGCTKLNNITMLATDISATSCLYDWMKNVASTGTFTKHPDMTSLPSGASGIPKGWTVVDYVA